MRATQVDKDVKKTGHTDRETDHSVLETYRWWSQRTLAVFLASPPAPRTRKPAGSSPGGQTLSPAWPLDCSDSHIPAEET